MLKEEFEAGLCQDCIIWHLKLLPEGDGVDGVLGGDEEGDDGAVGPDDHVFVGVAGDGLGDGRLKPHQSPFGRSRRVPLDILG